MPFLKIPCARFLGKVILGCSSEKVKGGTGRIGCLDLILRFSAEFCFKTSTHREPRNLAPLKITTNYLVRNAYIMKTGMILHLLMRIMTNIFRQQT